MPNRPPKKQNPPNDEMDFDFEDDELFSNEPDFMSVFENFMENGMKLTELTLQYAKKESFTREEIVKIYKANIKDVVSTMSVFEKF